MSENKQSNSTQGEIAISVKGLSKAYRIWRDPGARLKAPLWDAMGSIVPSALRPKALKKRLSHEGQSRYYTDFYALDKLDIELKKGEAIGIIGRNGSGKSTLLQMIAGTLTPTTGTIEVKGRIAALLELGSGFNPEFTGRENVFLNASILGLSQCEIESKLDTIIEFADIGSFIDQPVKTYSSGMVVRLAFAVQTAVDPDILIVDEALSVGDELFQKKCFSRIEQLREAGTTILFVSHDASSVIRLCQKAVLLKNGRIFVTGSPKAVVTIYQKSLFDESADEALLIEEFSAIEAQVDNNEHESIISPQNDTSEASLDTPELEDSAYMDPGLLKHQPISYSNVGAIISDVRIETLTGVPVNCLQHGNSYRYKYNTKFTKTASQVIFGCLIKMMDGLEVGGLISEPIHQSTLSILSGEEHQVSFDFRCLLSPGTYAFNAGVTGTIDTEDNYLARSIDAILFRVNAENQLTHTGMINFSDKEANQ